METNLIGNQIAKARKKINLSQAQLAEKLFISPQAVGKWERGESIPDIITINRLAEILGVDLNYFSGNFASAISETVLSKGSKVDHSERDSQEQGQELLTDFSGSNLPEGDFAGVVAHKRRFNGSALRGTNFSDADLTGSTFKGSDAHGANFDQANLTDCKFYAIDLTDASFNKTVLAGTEFGASDLSGAKFINAELSNVILSQVDLRKTFFENCIFKGVHFKQSDLRGMNLDGHTFTNVRFDRVAIGKATFKGATLKNVSFRPTFALTNKYYRDLKTISFDGAKMDKLTYASLKGMGADLSKVEIIKA